MKKGMTRYVQTAALSAIGTLALTVAMPARAAVVWELNPNHQNAPAGSTSVTYTQQGYSITAYGFNNNGGTGTPQELFYKNETPINSAAEIGLGVTNTFDNELQAGSTTTNPFDFIQLDLSSIIKAGATSGSVSVASIQSGEGFTIYGSNTLGQLGTQIGSTYGSNFDNTFVNLPDFGQFKYYSIAATTNDVLPVAVSAEIPPVPEMNALLPVIGLLAAIAMADALRRRRLARS